MGFTEITFSKVKTEIESFLQSEYSKASILFSNSSPYGQLLSVIENLFQLSNLYLKNSIKQFDIGDPNSLNERIIKNAAIYVGHIPGRNISATGTLLFTIKTNINIAQTIPGGRITLTDRQSLKNKTNGLYYSLDLGTDTQTYKINSNSQIYVNIIQGQWSSTTFTGDGTLNQTYQITQRGTKDIENFNYEVLVDGVYWTTNTFIYDMLPNDTACVVRTGFNGGIDVIFGNGGFGAIPEIGAVIVVNYIISDGSSGSIFRRTPNDWTFIDPAIDGFGQSLDLSTTFNTTIYTDINFGADKETISYTKSILPIVSPNFVLGLPQQFAYQIKKLGVFSHVNAFLDNSGVINIVATPNINLFKNQNADYFSVATASFGLDNYEKSKIIQYLQTNGNIVLSSKFQIVSPALSYYILNVFVILYSNAIADSVNSQIYTVISNYFLNLNKLDRIPKSDLVSLISAITDISSVDISFVSKDNEDYHASAIQADQNRRNQFASQSSLNISRPSTTYDPNATVGLDPSLGDIIFNSNEIPIIRGGWYDRNGIYYSDNIDDTILKSVNVIVIGTEDVKNKNMV